MIRENNNSENLKQRKDRLGRQYQPGSRVELGSLCNDEPGMPTGLRGTVAGIDDQPALLMQWDNRWSLSLLPGEDDFRKLSVDESMEEARQNQSAVPSSAILFPRVRLYTDTGEGCEFFVGGIPKSGDDLDGNVDRADFEEYLRAVSNKESEGVTAYVTSFTEGSGAMTDAAPEDIERIYTAIADVDIDAITGWSWVGESSFLFDISFGEQIGLSGIK